MSSNNSTPNGVKKNHQLFEYAIFWIPTDSEVKDGKKPEIIMQPTTILSADQQSAFLMAARSIPEKFKAEDLDQINIAVRPF